MTVAAAVTKCISEAPFLEEAITDGIINASGLARKIKSQVEASIGEPVKEGAIIMAIKRMVPSYYYQINAGIKNFIQKLGDFIVRSNIYDYTFKNSTSLLICQKNLLDAVNNRNEAFISFSQGIHESTIVASAYLHPHIIEIFEKETLLAHKKDLASITILLPKENTEISGIYYYIFKNLAWQNINIIEVISTTNEFTVLVAEKDIDSSFSILRHMKKKAAS